MENKDIINAHVCSSHNKEQLSKTNFCGCFYCLKMFDPKLIVDWCDNGQTAICPYCGTDSIVYESKAQPLTKPFLEQMKGYWF